MLSLDGIFFRHAFSVKICQMVNAKRIGGKTMFTRVFGISMIRKQITISEMRINGVYTLAPCRTWSPFNLMMSETKMASINQAISIISSVAISIRLCLMKVLTIITAMAKMKTASAVMRMGRFCLNVSVRKRLGSTHLKRILLSKAPPII